MAVFPGTDIEIGKWYPADLPPPHDQYGEDDDDQQNYELLLGLKDSGPCHGFYSEDEGIYYWHCERFDEFDFEQVHGWTFEQEVNNCLELTYEKARGVSCWMIIPAVPNQLPSIDGTNYYDPDPDQDWTVRKDEDEDDEEADIDDSDDPDPDPDTDPGAFDPWSQPRIFIGGNLLHDN